MPEKISNEEHVKIVSRGSPMLSGVGPNRCVSSLFQVRDCTSKTLTERRKEWQACDTYDNKRDCVTIGVRSPAEDVEEDKPEQPADTTENGPI